MKPLVVVDANIPGVHRYLGDCIDIRTVAGRDIDAAALAGAQALLVRSVTAVNEALLAGSQLRFVGSATSGTDHVDLGYLRDTGIAFAYAPGSNANSVVEYVLAAIAAVPGKLEQLLTGGRVGIVGFGNIGSLMATRLRGLGIEHCAYDPWLDQSRIDHPADLEEVLACDVVTLHPELTHRQPWPSYHLIAGEELSQLQPGALLVNVSRGAVIDNASLLEKLECGAVEAELVLDVWEGEPHIDTDLLGRVVLGTPHIAGYSYDGKLLATRMLCEQLAAILDLALQESPLPEVPRLSLAATSDDARLLRQVLNGRYDIRADDTGLRAAVLGRSLEDGAAAFDRLRRDYPRRRELFGSTVTGESFSDRQLTLLHALGCAVESGGLER